MEGWYWFAAIYLAILLYKYISHVRAKYILGTSVLNVKTPALIVLLVTCLVILSLSGAYIILKSLGADDSTKWYSNEKVVMTMLSLLLALLSIFSSIMDEQIREEGIFVGQRVYTWNELLNYDIQGRVIKIATSQTKFSGLPREIEWKVPRKMLNQVVVLLEENGVEVKKSS